jgi:hypothetical protein
MHSDHNAISNFVCAIPKKPKICAATGWQPQHRRIGDYHAQCMIRALSSDHAFPPRQEAVQIWVACDAEGVAAVVSWTELDGPGDVHLDVMGIAPRHRHPEGDPEHGTSREQSQRMP